MYLTGTPTAACAIAVSIWTGSTVWVRETMDMYDDMSARNDATEDRTVGSMGDEENSGAYFSGVNRHGAPWSVIVGFLRADDERIAGVTGQYMDDLPGWWRQLASRSLPDRETATFLARVADEQDVGLEAVTTDG